MRILIDARMYGLENTGIGRYITNLLSELSKLEDGSHEYIILLPTKYFTSLSLGKHFKKVEANYKHYTFAEQFFLPLEYFQYRPDITHFPHFNVPIFYPGKYIVTIHDLLMHKQYGKNATTLPYLLYLIKRCGYKLAFHKAVHSSSKIVTPTNTVKKELLSEYKIDSNKVFPIYEGVSKVDSKLQPDKVLKKHNLYKNYIIYTGNAYPHKNLERVIAAVAALNAESYSSKHSGLEFAIVGARGVFTKRLEQLVAKYNAKGHIKLLGYVPDEELSVLYSESLGFIYPSLTEGFGLPGLEAMSVGTLALVSKIPVFEEVYGKYAIYFDPYDINSIIHAINKIQKMSKKRRREKLEHNKMLLRRYSWHKMAMKTVKLYETK